MSLQLHDAPPATPLHPTASPSAPPMDHSPTQRSGSFWSGSLAEIIFGSLAGVALLAALGWGIVYTAAATATRTASTSTSSSHSSMNNGSASTSQTTANVPNATKSFGNQPATFTLDADCAKHFTFMAEQVMWQPVKRHSVLAWTINGMVPGPVIRVTAGDHVRVTLKNNFPEPTTLHFHGLEIPSAMDGVPGVGQKPIQQRQSFTYDFTVPLDNVGTFFYHSHYDDLTQVSGGMYGAFIVDPKPGTPEVSQVPAHDREYLQIISEMAGYYVINGKSFPDTQVMHVTHGQTTLVRLINLGQMIHPMHLHGHFFTIVAENGGVLPTPIRYRDDRAGGEL